MKPGWYSVVQGYSQHFNSLFRRAVCIVYAHNFDGCIFGFRGVAFEFRFKANRTKHFWDKSFILGSLLSSFFQGVILGAYIQELKLQMADM